MANEEHSWGFIFFACIAIVSIIWIFLLICKGISLIAEVNEILFAVVFLAIEIIIFVNLFRENKKSCLFIMGCILLLFGISTAFYKDSEKYKQRHPEKINKNISAQRGIEIYRLKTTQNGYAWQRASIEDREKCCEALANSALAQDYPRLTSQDYYQMCENFYSGNDDTSEARLKMTIAQVVSLSLTFYE